jgi:hypothetical protein
MEKQGAARVVVPKLMARRFLVLFVLDGAD